MSPRLGREPVTSRVATIYVSHALGYRELIIGLFYEMHGRAHALWLATQPIYIYRASQTVSTSYERIPRHVKNIARLRSNSFPLLKLLLRHWRHRNGLISNSQFSCVHVCAPPYLVDELSRLADSQARCKLWSASSVLLVICRTRLTTV